MITIILKEMVPNELSFSSLMIYAKSKEVINSVVDF